MEEQDQKGGGSDKGKMETMNISLPRELAEFVAKRVEGQFGNRSEYFRHLVREDAERPRPRPLDELIQEGLDSGPGVEVTPEYFEELRKRVRDRAARSKAG